MECYACANEASRQCKRCARVYCEEHGGELCAECLRPASSLPSFNLYRGSLLALLVGTAVAVWLLVQPPGESGESVVTVVQLTPSPSPPVVQTPRPLATRTPATPGATTTVESTRVPSSPTPEATPAPSEPFEYAVEPGDSLLSIAEYFLPPGEDLMEFANRIAELNGLDPEEPEIMAGDVLLIPR
jgi:hypothetical protein